ncbi:MAG TPA: protein kinase [Kofleriaceae bacterium]|nr:protein kinase [Kofleriaceae bacterium]
MAPDEPAGDAPDSGADAPASGKPRAVVATDDAFAATIAPTSLPVVPVATRPPADDVPHVPAGPRSRTVSGKLNAVIAEDSRVRTAAQQTDETLAAPVVGELPPLPVVPEAHYKHGSEIARGGMGRIVAAEDQRLGRPVALKELLEPAGDALGRFQREALITARLQHPGIVPVYEAGRWPTGEPFFAMKLVSGRPLDRVIAEAKTLEERLALLPRIAAATDAIAYAHSHRIVHRDLKPANVLIGDFGETVVIDWGLAKDLDVGDSPESQTRHDRPGAKRTPKPATNTASRTASIASHPPPSTRQVSSTTLTVAGAVMGTPAYMAPEQARGEPVDQRADVFALGAMLYHLLAGVPPYNARTATDVIAAAALGRVIPHAEREAGAPRDLVAIVERAMRQSPAERYPDAGALADELRRFLTGQLVSAHRYTPLQRLSRFLKKHQAAVTIATISVVTLAVGGTLAVRQIVQQRDAARYERQVADIRRRAAEAMIDEMLSDVKDRLVQIGRLDLLTSLGTQIRTYYGTLARIPGGMPVDDVDRMAVAVELLGRAERDSGDSARARKTWMDMRDQLAAAVGSDAGPTTIKKRMMIARLDFQLGTIDQATGKSAAALASYERAKQQFNALRTEAPNDRQILLFSAENHDRRGDLLRNDGKLDEAFEDYSAAKLERERATTLPGHGTDDIVALATSHLKIGSIYQARGESATALAEYRAALRLRETLLEARPDAVDLQQGLLDVQDTLASLQRQIGDTKSAIETYQNSLPIVEALIRHDPANTLWKRQRGNVFADLGFTLLDTGAFSDGLAQLDQAIAAQIELAAIDPKNTSWQVDLSRSHTRAGDARLYLGAIDEAIASYGRGLAIREQLAEKNPKSAPYRRSLAFSHHKLATAYALKGDVTRALASHEQALALRTKLVDEAPNQSGFKNELAASEIYLGKLVAARDAGRGTKLIESGVTRARALVAADPINNEWKETLTQGLLARGEAARIAGDRTARQAAISDALATATAGMQRAPQNVHWIGLVAEAHAQLAELADPKAAGTEWKAVRELLEPLAKANQLPAARKPLLERARAAR